MKNEILELEVKTDKAISEVEYLKKEIKKHLLRLNKRQNGN